MQARMRCALRHGWRLPALTPSRAAAALAGAVAVQALPQLPWPIWMAAVLVVALVAVLHHRSDRLPWWFLLGLAWTVLRADAWLDARLADAWHGRDFLVTGRIDDLPRVGVDGTRFELRIERAELDGAPVAFAGPVRVTWYDDAPTLEPCSRWTLVLRLRPPRGLVNPGTGDSERNAAQRGRVAVGYVRRSGDNAKLDDGAATCIDRTRARIATAIDGELGAGTPATLLRALAVGDQSGIAEADWRILRATGIGHLIAISGLHVGMFAVFGAWLARRVWKCWPWLVTRVPGPLIEAPVALACACGYGLLAGMGLPTVRTLLMIAVALVARFARRGTSVPQALGLAALAIVAWDPLAVLSAGFWLSFVGVAILLAVTTPVGDERPSWREMPRTQLWLSATLLPLGVWFFGQASLVGPLANLVAVPWISFVVVPVTVAASLLLACAPTLGVPVLHLAELLLRPCWWLMARMADWPLAQAGFASVPAWSFALAVVGLVWFVLPRGVPLRGCGLVLVLPMLLPARPPVAGGEFTVTMFDVGQGLAVLVRTQGHALVYDAGARHPGGFDAGDAIVIPALQALGVRTLDRIVISHGDNDHAGGAEALHLAFPHAHISAGEPARLRVPAQACVEREAWSWDGVDFERLPPAPATAARGNDHSCVLRVTGAHGSLLLTGDISARSEPAVAAAIGALAPPLLVSVPHHGSRSASSAAFLDALTPDEAWVSAGHRNRFGHPHAEVVARYRERGIVLENTAASGCLERRFTRDDAGTRHCRELRRAWWRFE